VFCFSSTWTIFVIFAWHYYFVILFCLTLLLLCTPLPQNYCSTLLVWHVVVLILLNVIVVLRSSYLKLLLYSYIQHVVMCFLLNLLFSSSYSTSMLFLLNNGVILIWHCYSTPLARPTTPFLLLNVVDHLAQRCCFLLIHVPLYYSHDFVVIRSF